MICRTNHKVSLVVTDAAKGLPHMLLDMESILLSLQIALLPSFRALDVSLETLQAHVISSLKAVFGVESLVEIVMLHPEARDQCDGGDDSGHDVQRLQGSGVRLAHCVTLGARRSSLHPVNESGGVGCQSVGAVGEIGVSAEVDDKAAVKVR